MNRTDRALWGLAVGPLAAVLLGAAMVGVRSDVANANVALALVIPVFLGAAVGGRLAGAASALAAAMSFDFFHTRPYGSLKIGSATDLEATVLLLLLGLAVGQVATWAIESRRATVRHVDPLRRLNRVARLAIDSTDADGLAQTIVGELRDMLRLRDCWFERRPFIGEFLEIGEDGSIDQPVRRVAPGGGFDLPADGVQVPVTVNHERVARFVLIPSVGTGVTPEQRLVAVALASQLGIVLARSSV